MVENPQDNKIPTFFEPIASDIRPGFISPNEDLSLAEFKVSLNTSSPNNLPRFLKRRRTSPVMTSKIEFHR